MNESKAFKNIIENILKRDKLDRLKRMAYEGNKFAQLALGDIFFYGINTDDGYVREIERIITLMEYSKRKKTKYSRPKSKVTVINNQAILCECSEVPDYAEALKWYTMAAMSGKKETIENMRMIKEDEAPKITEEINGQYMLQIFQIESKERG